MNKFKVGDRVRIYNTWPAPIKAIAIITEVNGDLVRTSYYDNLFHYKQCRRLIKKPKYKYQYNDFVTSSSREFAVGKIIGLPIDKRGLFAVLTEKGIMVYTEQDFKKLNIKVED